MITILICAWLLADLISGLGHWVQDRFVHSTSKIGFIKSIAIDNELHHARPAAMLKNSWWSNISTTAVIVWPCALGLFLLGSPTVIWLAMFFTGFANLVHRFSHMHPSKVPVLVRFLQRTGIFISRDHHWRHHFHNGRLVMKKETTVRFCAMTNWLNPLIDFIRGET